MDEFLPQIASIAIVIAIALVPVALGILYRLIRPYLAFKLGAEKLLLLEGMSMVLVRSAEQIGRRIGLDGQDKKMMVMGLLDNLTGALKIEIDRDLLNELIDNMIEGSVKKLRIEETIAKGDTSKKKLESD